MIDAVGRVDGKATAKRVEACRSAGITLSGHRQGIDMRDSNRTAVEPSQLHIQERQVEFGIVDYQRTRAEKCEQIVGDRGKRRMRSEKFRG